MSVELPNLWTRYDLPVLLHVAQQIEVEHRSEIDPSAIADGLGVEGEDVARALIRLFEAEYVKGFDASGLNDRHVLVTGMTERGRREVGMWPSSAEGAALLEVIERAAAQEPDEEKRGALRELLRSARNVGEGTLGSIAATLATRLTLGA